MFRIELLPALHGDSIWIEYGDIKNPYRILIDGGPLQTYKFLRSRIEKIPEDERHFELFVLTHVDADHIESTVKLLNVEKLDFELGDIWFNAWRHLLPSHKDELGPVQGEYVSALIKKHDIPWNNAFGSGPVAVPESGDLPVVKLQGGMKLTLLSPDRSRLSKLAPEWAKAVRSAGLEPGIPGDALTDLSKKKRYRPPDELGEGRFDITALADSPFESDSTAPNGSSIAFIAEYQGKSCLFLGDSHASPIVDGIKRLLSKSGEDKLSVDAVKLPHHGSRHNVSRELIESLKSPSYLVSTNGDKFEHPDAEAIARIIKYSSRPPDIFFNYLSDTTGIWKEAYLHGRSGFSVHYPEAEKAGIVIEL